VQWLVAAVVLVLYFRGQGGHRELAGLVLFVPLLRFVLSPVFRQRVRARYRELWRDFETYPLLGKIPWKATAVCVVLPAGLFYLSSTSHLTNGDSWPVVPTTWSLATHGRWNIDEFVGLAPATYAAAPEGLPYCTTRREGEIYSDYPSGMVPFALPVVAIARLAGADCHQAQVFRRLEKWTAVWVAAGALGFFFLIALHLVLPRQAWAMTALLAAGSVMGSTVAQGLWQHGGIIFWSLLILLIEFQRKTTPLPAGTLVQGIGGAMMLACRLTAVVFLVPFAFWILARSPKRALRLVVLGGLAFLPWACEYWLIYGKILGPSFHQAAGMNWTLNLTDGLAGVLISPGRGLLVYQPWLLLGTAAVLPAVRIRLAQGRPEPCPRGFTVVCLTVIVLHVAVIAAWRCWWGGHCWGSRLAADIVPLAALLCVRPIVALWHYSIGRPAVACAAAAAILIHSVPVYGHARNWNTWIDIDHHPDRLWSWSHPPFLYPFQSRQGLGGQMGHRGPIRAS
jgi:hypothetical protein